MKYKIMIQLKNMLENKCALIKLCKRKLIIKKLDLKEGSIIIYTDGFIVVIFSGMINIMQSISLVEICKKRAFIFLKPTTDAQYKHIGNIIIDLFMVLKWIMIVLSILNQWNNTITTVLVTYLLIMNVHTYFYYHVWEENVIRSKKRTVKNIRRRIINLFLSYGFIIAVYTYYYSLTFIQHFEFPISNFSKFICAIYHSFASAFTGGSGYMSPISSIGLLVQVSQIFVTFVFLGIIFSKTDCVIEEE